jgi:hypothetical protein
MTVAGGVINLFKSLSPEDARSWYSSHGSVMAGDSIPLRRKILIYFGVFVRSKRACTQSEEAPSLFTNPPEVKRVQLLIRIFASSVVYFTCVDL